MTSTTFKDHREALQDRQSAKGDPLVGDLFRYSCNKTQREEIYGLVETLIVTGKRGTHHIQRMADFLNRFGNHRSCSNRGRWTEEDIRILIAFLDKKG